MADENPVFRSLEIIENRISEKLTVENIAGSVYFSKYHYWRLFREVVGDSVMEYVAKRRLTLAGRAMLETGDTILNIALNFGFDSHEGFTRSFKAYMGVTPTDYRKYGLAAISQKIVKEKNGMTYSKTTDEIIRELNDFIVKAKDAAALARKNRVDEYVPFWGMVANTADNIADNVNAAMERVTIIAEHPDEITSRLAIIKAIDEAAFQSNLLMFNVNLTVARGKPGHVQAHKPLCEKFTGLAIAASQKAGKISQFLSELSQLIFEDMRKTADSKIQEAVHKGKLAAEDIAGQLYLYIKDEIISITNCLSSVPVEEITILQLEDCLFMLNIISFAADMDCIRNPADKEMFSSIAGFRDSLSDAVAFFRTLVPVPSQAAGTNTRKLFEDIAFQGNILLFYTAGELSAGKLGMSLDGAQETAFLEICRGINEFIELVQKASDESAFREIAEKLHTVSTAMTREAEKLNERGGALRYIAAELSRLAKQIQSRVK